MKAIILILSAAITVSYGVELTNYDLSRNRLGNGPAHAGSYGQHYPSGPGYPGGQYGNGHYPGGQYGNGHYGGGYPHQGPAGPPGAHPGCPLCDSSVYSYCSYKQTHDACCCDNPTYAPFTCRKSSCGYLYANSCEEYHLISSCCCVDLYKNGVTPSPLPIAS